MKTHSRKRDSLVLDMTHTPVQERVRVLEHGANLEIELDGAPFRSG